MDEDALEIAEARLRLLALTVELCAASARLVASGGGSESELNEHAEYVAKCLSQPVTTRGLAGDIAELAAVEARRLLGDDRELTSDQFVRAMELTSVFALRVRGSVRA